MRSLLDKWAVQVKALKIAVRSHMFNGPKRLLKRSLQDMAVGYVLNLKRDMSSLASAWHLPWHNLHQVDRLATFGVYHNLFFSFILFIYFDAHINGGQIFWCSYQWRSYILTLISMVVIYFDAHINGSHVLWHSYQWGSYILMLISMGVIYFDDHINGGHIFWHLIIGGHIIWHLYQWRSSKPSILLDVSDIHE